MNRCPNENELQGLLSDRLPVDIKAAVEGHIEACPTCQRHLDTLTQALDLHLGASRACAEPQPAFLQRLQAQYPATLLHGAAATSSTLHFPGPASETAPLGQVGDFEILEELGSGSFGWVFRARERSLKRIVALKVLKPEMTARPDAIMRFEREARKASLKHDHIVSIYRFEKADGFPPYLVMEFVAGETLDAKLQRDGKLPPEEAASIARQIALGLAAAHAVGMVHRDIKPANILLDKTTGRAKISDFGLARDIAGESLAVTGAGELAGTAPYMSPEHFRAPETVDGRSDVFSLGIVLYQMLTGKLPFQGSFLQIRTGILDDEPTAPRRLNANVPVDLETIALACLEKEPQRRYATAHAVAEDLRRYQNGEPILCRPTGRVERARKWMVRKPAQAGLVGVGAIAALALIVLMVVQIFYAQLQAANASLGQARDELQQTNKDLGTAKNDLLQTNVTLSGEKAAVRRLNYIADMNLAHQAWQSDNFRLLEQYLAAHDQSEFRGFEWHYLRWLAGVDGRRIGPDDPVTAAAFDRTGRRLALGVAAEKGTQLQLWAAPSRDKPRGQLLHALTIPDDEIRDIAFHPQDDWLIASDRGGTIGIWDVKNGRQVQAIDGNGPFAISADSQQLAFVRLDGGIQRWHVAGKREVGAPLEFGDVNATDADKSLPPRMPPGGSNKSLPPRMKPDGSDKSKLSGKPSKLLDRGGKSIGAPIQQIAFSHDGQRLAAVAGHYSVGGMLALWDLKSGQRLPVKDDRSNDLLAGVAFSPELSAPTVAAVGYDHALRVWDAKTGSLRFRRNAHKLEVLGVAFNAAGDRIATAGWDKAVRLWNARTGEELANLRGNRGVVLQVLFCPDTKEFGRETIVSRNEHGELRWWDPEQEQSARVLRLNEAVHALSFSPKGRYLAALGRNSQVLVQDLGRLERRFELTLSSPVTRGLFDTSERALFMAGIDGILRNWDFVANDLRAGQGKASLAGKRALMRGADAGWSISPLHEPTQTPIAFGATPAHDTKLVAVDDAGQLLAFANKNGSGIVLRRRASSAETMLSFPITSNGSVNALAFSPDGRSLAAATGDRDNSIFFFDTQSGTLRHHLTGHLCFVSCVAFSPDGKRLVSGSEDWTVKIWDVDIGRAALTLSGHKGRIRDLAFSPDGNWLASASEDATVRLWPGVLNDADERWQLRDVPSKLIRGK